MLRAELAKAEAAFEAAEKEIVAAAADKERRSPTPSGRSRWRGRRHPPCDATSRSRALGEPDDSPLAKCWQSCEALPLPKAGDWLAKGQPGEKDRPGQSVAQFCRPGRALPSRAAGVVYLAPIGSVSGAPPIRTLCDFLHAMFGLEVRELQSIQRTKAVDGVISRTADYKPHGPMINAQETLDLMRKEKPRDAFLVLGYTMDCMQAHAAGLEDVKGAGAAAEEEEEPEEEQDTKEEEQGGGGFGGLFGGDRLQKEAEKERKKAAAKAAAEAKATAAANAAVGAAGVRVCRGAAQPRCRPRLVCALPGRWMHARRHPRRRRLPVRLPIGRGPLELPAAVRVEPRPCGGAAPRHCAGRARPLPPQWRVPPGGDGLAALVPEPDHPQEDECCDGGGRKGGCGADDAVGRVARKARGVDDRLRRGHGFVDDKAAGEVRLAVLEAVLNSAQQAERQLQQNADSELERELERVRRRPGAMRPRRGSSRASTRRRPLPSPPHTRRRRPPAMGRHRRSGRAPRGRRRRRSGQRRATSRSRWLRREGRRRPPRRRPW